MNEIENAELWLAWGWDCWGRC